MSDSEEREEPARRWLVPMCLLISVFAIYGLTATRDSVSVDAHAASLEAWHIAATGSPWLDDVKSAPAVSQDFFVGEAANGHVVALRMAGPVLLGVPFYLALNRDADPASFTVGPAGIAAAALSALTVLLLFLAIRRLTPPVVAIAGAAAFALATPTWSVSADGLWTHTLTQFGLAGAAYSGSRGRWWLAGSFLGIGMLGRPHLALIAAIVGLGVAWSRRDFKPALAVGAPTIASLGVLLMWNQWMFGSLSIGGAYQGRTEAVATGQESQWLNYLGFLVSLDRGFLVWTPAVVAMLPALVRSWRRLPDWTRWLGVGGLLYSLVQMRLNHFAGGDAFYGYRHGLELLSCLAPALILAVPNLGRRIRTVLLVLLAVQFAAVTLGAASETFLLPLDRAWGDNSFWLALRSQPSVVLPWLASCVGAGLVASSRISRRTAAVSTVGGRYGQHSPVD